MTADVIVRPVINILSSKKETGYRHAAVNLWKLWIRSLVGLFFWAKINL